jgi:hypothetical protein
LIKHLGFLLAESTEMRKYLGKMRKHLQVLRKQYAFLLIKFDFIYIFDEDGKLIWHGNGFLL